MGRELAALESSEAERPVLGSLVARRNTALALALRARIVLACAEGGQNKVIAARLGLDRQTVGASSNSAWTAFGPKPFRRTTSEPAH